MGMWALAVTLATLVRIGLQGPQSRAPSPVALTPACSSLVAWHQARGAVIRCGSDAAFASVASLQHGDAILGEGPFEVRPGGMSDATRLALGLPLNVNTVSYACLTLIPGISPAVAQRVVEQRAALGGFPSLAALRQVRGIGPATLSKIQGQLWVAPHP